MNKEILKFKNVWVDYNNVNVLEDISFSVNENDFLAIIGPNGGGKTTLLKTILNLIPVKKGTISLFNEAPSRTKKLVGYVPQITSFDQDFPITVFDTILMGRLSHRKMHGCCSHYQAHIANNKNIAQELMKKMSIEHLKNRKLGHLSGGERQRVLIARALASQPQLLLLDEPTSNIDPEIKTSLYDLLVQLKKEMAIILVTHDVGVISSYVDKIACLNNQLYYHDAKEISPEALEKTYHCPVDLIAHGLPHRVLKKH